MTNATLNHVSLDDARAARKLVRLILSREYFISVYDGEDWPIKRSRAFRNILANMGATSEEWLSLHDANGNRIGAFLLVWGNSGEELIADYSDNDALDSIWNDWQASL